MEVKKFFEENVKPLISNKLREIEEDFDLNELGSYEYHRAYNYYDHNYHDYDEDELNEACIKYLVEGIEADGVFEVFYKEMTEEARKVLYDATDEYNEALDKMTIQYIEE